MLWILPFAATVCQAAISSPEHDLMDYLMMNSSDRAIPVFKRSTTMHIEIGMELIEILEVDTPHQMMRILAWMRLIWRNELLVWDPKQFNGINTVRLHKDSIWLPDITLYNALDGHSKDEKQHSFPPTPIVAKHDGSLRYAYPINQAFSCKLNPGDFPKDSHTCSMEFGSWTFDAKEMSISVENSPITTSEYISSAEWELIEAKKFNYSQKYDCCTVPYSKVEFQFTIRRKHLFYVITTYLPCLLLMLSLLLGHLLPSQSGEKVTLSLSVLLAFFVFLQAASGHVPRSEEISSLGLVLFLALIGITFSTFITCLVLNLHFKDPENDAIPIWLLGLLSYVTRVLLVCRKKESKEEFMKGEKNDNAIILVKPASQSLHSSARDKRFHEVKLVRSASVLSHKGHRVREVWTSRRRKRKINAKFQELLVLTKEIRTYQEEWMTTDEVNSWQRLALLIDRSAFVIYSCATFVSALVFLY